MASEKQGSYLHAGDGASNMWVRFAATFPQVLCKDMLLMSKCPLAGSLEPAKLVVLQICFHLIISCFTFRHVTATSKHYPSGVVH